MATITTFEAGYCTHPGCVALRGERFASRAFPSRSYLLEAHGRVWLWDTGYASHFLDHTRNGVFALYRKIIPVHFEAADAIVAQLVRAGLRPWDIAGVVVSHFHGDHIAGLRDFPGVPLICSGEGWQKVRQLRGFPALTRGFVPGLIPEDFDSRACFVEAFEQVALPSELLPFTHGYALPDAGGDILIVELPGHAAGHLGAFVATEDGWVLLASDSAWSRQGYREPRGPSRIAHMVMDDPRAYYVTLDRLHQLDARGGVTILLTHEGAQ